MNHRPAWIALPVLVALAAPTPAGTHVDEKIGYRLFVPKDFEPVPLDEISIDGASLDADYYLLARWRSKKEIYPKNFPFGYRRALAVFFFPKRTAKEIAELERKAKEEREKAKQGSVTISRNEKIYLTFEDYAKERIRGFFFENVKKAKVAGFPATLYEMKFEKLTNVPQRWTACALDVPNGQFAILFSCTDQHHKDYRGERRKVFQSFKLLDPSGLRPKPWSVDPTVAVDMPDEEKLSPEEKLRFLERKKRERYDECIRELDKGWRHFETEHFLFVYACDGAFAKKAAKHAEAVVDWLEKTFGGVGDGHVQGAIVRIYASGDDLPLRTVTISLAAAAVPEFRIAKPTSKGLVAEFASLNVNVLSHWFSDKNDQLWDRMPAWLETGLREVVEDATLKGSRLVFQPDEFEKQWLTEAKNADKKYQGPEALRPIKPLKVLFTMERDRLFSGRSADAARAQCASVVRYLIDGPGARRKQTTDLLDRYKERAAERAGRAGLSDEERLKREDEEYRKRRELAYDKVAKQLLADTFRDTFSGWSEQDWKALDASWRKFMEGRSK